ncbi:hypothetical protein L1887_18862 [Cichorium endivia]|nr:hypothetical protein L1887_18862 [Cichorium endivia]
MALVILHLIFLTIFLRFIAAQQTNGSVAVGASLIATPNVKPWLSSSGEFAFGFQQVQGNDKFLLSIWYDKIPDKTVIWYPEEGPLVPTGSKVELIRGSGLVLSNPQGRQIWTSGPISDLAFGHMNDTGNFVIVGSNSRKIWDSFDFPADTMLPTQLMVRGGVINSKMSNTNYSGGRFQLRLLQNGNLVLNTRNIPSGFAYEPYYISGTYDAVNSTNSGERVIFDETGDMYILRGSGQRFDLTTRGALPSGDYYHRATLDSDGVFRQYYYPKNPTGNTSWEVIWFEPENICLNIRGNLDSGACGFNNVCSFDGDRANCACPQGFSLLDPNDANGDCKPDFTPSCHEVESNNGGDTFDFIELNGIDWPQCDYEHLEPANEQSCKSSCLEDCFCAAVAYRDGECWKKRLPLSNGRKLASSKVKTFLKFRKGDPAGTPPRLLGKYKDQRTLILRLLIYEYMSNGTLAVFLFGDTRPTWKERSCIAVGIAKGLSYLHEECSTQIIHCDIKPQNILLDDYFNAKISDFGLAKLLLMNQSQTNTGIRGTKGYVAPEWFRNTPVTVKVDVYSFGVLLLEIISCRKSLVLESNYESVSVLTDLAWDYYLKGRLDALVEKDLEALDDYKNLTRFVMVGLWCIQENSSLRPTMRKVAQMLEGEIEVAEPPCPVPLSVTTC